MKKNRLTINEIRAKYSAEKEAFDKRNPLAYFVLRRASYYPTWLFLKLGISANKVSVAGLIAGCIGAILFAFGSYSSAIVGAILVCVYSMLDYVDGNIARYTDTCSKYGAFADSTNGAIIGTLLFLCVGIGVFNHPDPYLNTFIRYFWGIDIDRSTFLILGGFASSMSILASYVVTLFAAKFSIEQVSIAVVPETKKGRQLYSIPSKVAHNIIVNRITILLLAAILGAMSLFIMIYAIVYTCSFIVGFIQISRTARKLS